MRGDEVDEVIKTSSLEEPSVYDGHEMVQERRATIAVALKTNVFVSQGTLLSIHNPLLRLSKYHTHAVTEPTSHCTQNAYEETPFGAREGSMQGPVSVLCMWTET